MLKRMSGLFLLVIAAAVAVHVIVEPLYHTSSETQMYSPLWVVLDPLMVLAVVLGVIFGGIRKRAVDSEGGSRGDYARVPCRQHAVLRIPVRGHPVTLELVQPTQPRIHRRPQQERIQLASCRYSSMPRCRCFRAQWGYSYCGAAATNRSAAPSSLRSE